MDVEFTRYEFPETGELYFATDRAATDEYSNLTRTAYRPDPLIRYALERLRPGDTFIDIGANIGHFTLPLAKRGVRTLAVEALPRNAVLLLKAIQRNGLHNVTLVHAAASRATGLARMVGESAWAQVTADDTGLEVPAFSIDDLVETFGFRDAALLKMDVEGSEYAALEGMSQLLEANRELDLIVEANVWTCRSQAHNPEILLRRLEQAGYRLYMFHDDALVPRRSGDFQEAVYRDYLATRREPPTSTGSFVVRTLSADERAAAVVQQMHAPNPESRAYIAAVADRVPADVGSRPEVRAGLDRLAEEAATDETFRHMVSDVRAVVQRGGRGGGAPRASAPGDGGRTLWSGVVLGIQGAQAGFGVFRGIGRYVASHAVALARRCPGISVHTDAALPSPADRRLESLTPTDESRRHVLPPAIYHVMSPFNPGPLEQVWPAWARGPGTSLVVTLYDLIPLVFAEQYLAEAAVREGYEARMELVRSARAVLAISESTARDAVRWLGIPPERVHVVGAGCSEAFQPPRTSREEIVRALATSLPGLAPNYLLIVGGMDHRKNMPTAIAAYARLPHAVRTESQLVVTGELSPEARASLTDIAREHGVDDRVLLAGHVPDATLVALYQACRLFVCPSLYEGFGLPVLEALSCGAPAVVSGTSSLPEIVPDPEAQFDARSADDMRRVIEHVVRDPGLERRLRERAPAWAAAFTWERVADATAQVYERLLTEPRPAATERAIGRAVRIVPTAVDVVPGALTSPLLEEAPGAPLPGLVSLERALPCNDSALRLGPPLVATLPERCWAYGVAFPLDEGVLGGSGRRPVVVSLELAVDAGRVGVMGVTGGLDRATTMEIFVGPGSASLRLDAPMDTSAVVVRNAGEGGTAPRVTVTRIAAHERGGQRLVARAHDLGFDLFVVLSPAKTATQTIERTLRALTPDVQVRRAHALSEALFGRLPDYVAPDDTLARVIRWQVEYGRTVSMELAAVRALGGRVAFVTTMREPIDRAIAALFESLPWAVPVFPELPARAGGAFLDLLEQALIDYLRQAVRGPHEVTLVNWMGAPLQGARRLFREEFPRLVGVDLLAHPFDRQAGFTLVRGERETVLAFRYEDLGRALVPGLAALTGRREIAVQDANRSEGKPYRSLYREFRARLRMPPDLVADVYDDPCVRHFYGRDEIAAFTERWTRARE